MAMHPRVLNRHVDSFDQWDVELGKVVAHRMPRKKATSLLLLPRRAAKPSSTLNFEYGKDFGKHIEAFDPTFAKVLVRYNPEGDATLNERQAARLKLLSNFLHGNRRSLFMFELLVLPEQAQMDKLNGDQTA